MTPTSWPRSATRSRTARAFVSTCHTIGTSEATLRFPDLAGVGRARQDARVPGSTSSNTSPQTLCDPDAFIVPGFNPGMPTINKPPIGLSDEELHAVIAWLQSQGGEPTITLKDQAAVLRTRASVVNLPVVLPILAVMVLLRLLRAGAAPVGDRVVDRACTSS